MCEGKIIHLPSPLFSSFKALPTVTSITTLYQIMGEANFTEELFETVKAGCDGSVELLLELGADVNAQDADGRTPLSWVVESQILSKRMQMAMALIAGGGVKPDVKDN